MFDFSKLTLGVVTTRRDTFPSVEKAIAKNDVILERISGILDGIDNLDIVNASDVVPGGLICELSETRKVIEYFKEKKVEAILMLHANFGQEEAVGRLCSALNVPVLLWGPRDGAKDSDEGFRDGDTQCGMFASTRALLRLGVPFTYAENTWIDGVEIENEIKDFVRVASVVRAFRNMRILQIGSRPRQFLSVKINESELMEKFGFELTTIETTIMAAEAEKVYENKKDEIYALLDQISDKYDFSDVPTENKERIMSFVIAIKDLAEHYDCTTVACECWNVPYFVNKMKIGGCLTFAILEDLGITVSCECDVNGAVSAAIARGAARGDSAAFFADVTVRHPYNDNAELMWHCGRYPASVSKNSVVKADGAGRLCHELKEGDITMIRFDADKGTYYLFADEGRGIEGPETSGAYVWLETESWPKWEKKLMYGPYIHHMAGVYGKYKEIIREATKYFDVQFDCAT